MAPWVTTQRIGGALVATLSRAPVNAIDGTLIAQLNAVLDAALADDDVTLLHLRSDQRVFCAGVDLALMRNCFATQYGPAAMTDVVRNMQHLYARLEDAPLVTLAEIGGAAMGGGLELALACDLRVAALQARLGLPEASLGLVPGAGGTQRLTRLCGTGVAKRLILGAEVIDGAQAQQLGIVQWALPGDELAAWARDLAARLAQIPKAALAAGKRCIAAQGQPQRDGYAEEIAATRMLYDHPETRSKVSEFLARSAARAHKEMK